MASPSEILDLRGMINDNDEPYEFDNDTLSAYLDSSSSLNEAAYRVWLRKAASFSTSVDVSESGSSRKNSDLYDNAMDQVKFYRGLITPEPGTPGSVDNAPFTVQAQRG